MGIANTSLSSTLLTTPKNMKKIKLQLVGLDGNAFSVMGAFQRQACKEGWSKQEVSEVLDEAMSGDYTHLLATIAHRCVNPL